MVIDGDKAVAAAFVKARGEMSHLCECGCGQETAIATRNEYRRGQVKGQPIRFLPGHHSRGETLHTATEKLCPKCQRVLPVASFQKGARDAYQARCRECRREDQRASKERHAERDKRWREANPDKARERTLRYRQAYNEKRMAHSKVGDAVRRGDLPPISERKCSQCGKQANHYHHDSYDCPLDVTPVCSACHKLIHTGEIK